MRLSRPETGSWPRGQGAGRGRGTRKRTKAARSDAQPQTRRIATSVSEPPPNPLQAPKAIIVSRPFKKDGRVRCLLLAPNE